MEFARNTSPSASTLHHCTDDGYQQGDEQLTEQNRRLYARFMEAINGRSSPTQALVQHPKHFGTMAKKQ